MTTTLYEIGAEFAALEAALTESGGELTPDVEAAWDALGVLERDRVDAYRAVCVSLDAHAKACEAEAAVFQAKAAVATNSRRRLMERLKVYMECRGVSELKGDKFTAKLQKNGGKQPLVITAQSAEDIPAHLRLPPEVRPDTDAIRAVLISGGLTEIAGLARLEPVGTHLRWR